MITRRARLLETEAGSLDEAPRLLSGWSVWEEARKVEFMENIWEDDAWITSAFVVRIRS